MKKILHTLIRGMDPYESFGVITLYWDLIVKLTQEIYGDVGVSVLKSAHRQSDYPVDSKHTIVWHTLEKWENNGNTQVGPEEIIDRLEKLL